MPRAAGLGRAWGALPAQSQKILHNYDESVGISTRSQCGIHPLGDVEGSVVEGSVAQASIEHIIQKLRWFQTDTDSDLSIEEVLFRVYIRAHLLRGVLINCLTITTLNLPEQPSLRYVNSRMSFTDIGRSDPLAANMMQSTAANTIITVADPSTMI